MNALNHGQIALGDEIDRLNTEIAEAERMEMLRAKFREVVADAIEALATAMLSPGVDPSHLERARRDLDSAFELSGEINPFDLDDKENALSKTFSTIFEDAVARGRTIEDVFDWMADEHNDERLDDPRHGQAKDINRVIR